MKKSFLKTFIVLGLFSIFLLGNISISNAQYDPGALSKVTGSGNSTTVGTGSSSTPLAGNAANAGHEDNWFTNGAQAFAMSLLIYGSMFVSWIVSFAGGLFDQVIKYTTTYPQVLNEGIVNSWKIIRDFSNIILVFSLLYLGIKTIIQGDGFADKKTLVSIIIAAVLINFSLVFVRDIAFNLSNIVGNQILQQSGLETNPANDISPSTQLMKIVNPQQVLALNGFGSGWGAINIAINDRTDWGLVFKMAGQFIMFTAIVISLAFIFVGASIMLLYRFVIFIILMIASPFGLISTQIPWLKKHGDEWLEHLKKQTLFYPAFVIVLYIVLLIVSTLAAAGFGSMGNTLNADTFSSVFAFLFNFVLILGFMISLLILPGKFSMAGSEMMTSVGTWGKDKLKNMPKRTLQRTAQGAASVTARGGRLVLGRGIGNSIAENKNLKEKAQQKGVGGFFARQAIKAGDGLRNKTYDIRNTDTVKKSNFGKGMGTGIENYVKAVETRKKEIDKTKKDEMKRYGFDKLKADPIKVRDAEKARDRLEEEFKQKKTAYFANPTDATIKANYENAQKSLEEAEANVAKAKKPGESKYQDNIADPRRNLSWMEHVPFAGGRLQSAVVGLMNKTTVRNVAYTELKDDLYKKLKEDGQSKAKKKEKAEDNWINAAASGNTSAPPPANNAPAPAVTTTVGNSGGTTTV